MFLRNGYNGVKIWCKAWPNTELVCVGGVPHKRASKAKQAHSEKCRFLTPFLEIFEAIFRLRPQGSFGRKNGRYLYGIFSVYPIEWGRIRPFAFFGGFFVLIVAAPLGAPGSNALRCYASRDAWSS